MMIRVFSTCSCSPKRPSRCARLARKRRASCFSAFRAGVGGTRRRDVMEQFAHLDAATDVVTIDGALPRPSHACLAEAGPLDLKWRCSSTSLRLLPRIVLGVDVGKSPGTVSADLYNRLFVVDEDVVRRA